METNGEKRASILIVEDDLVIRSNLEILLTEMGHDIAGFADNPIDALVLFSARSPDVVIVDISLDGPTDGVDLVKKMNVIRRTPVLFLTAHSEEEIFNKAKAVSPFAFITKPIERINLERSIQLALENLNTEGNMFHAPNPCNQDALYTRVGNKLKKIYIRDIEFIEVDGKYCTIHQGARNFNCKISLKELVHLLPGDRFVQVSRNYLVNMDSIEDIDMLHFHVKVPHAEIPISRIYKEGLFERMKII